VDAGDFIQSALLLDPTASEGSQRMSEDEIQNLVERARSGDDAAFTALYHAFASRVYRFFRFRVTTAEAAEDLTQRVFLKMIEQLPTYEPRGVPFAAWLFRVARNAWIDDSRTSRRSVPLDTLSQSVSPHDGPDLLAMAAIDSRSLKEAIDRLPEAQREVIACRFFAGLSHQETAAQMGRSEGAVRILQHRALEGLRKRLPHMAGVAGAGSGVTTR
jgi:RNA polymerase sigma-70 factor, ECF subfamily